MRGGVVPLPLGELGDVVPGVVGEVVLSAGKVGVPLPLVPLPLAPLPLEPLVPLPPVPLPVPLLLSMPLVPVPPVVDPPVVDPLVPLPLPLPLVPVPVPVPLLPPVPLVPLVPEELVGAVLVSPLAPDGVVVVSDFLQAPSMAAMTAAVRIIFDVLEIAFIV